MSMLLYYTRIVRYSYIATVGHIRIIIIVMYVGTDNLVDFLKDIDQCAVVHRYNNYKILQIGIELTRRRHQRPLLV